LPNWNTSEIGVIKKKFHTISGNIDTINYDHFSRICCSSNSDYARKYLLPKIFTFLDTKKDGFLDFEE
jgi:hypothetical protein